MVARSRLRLGVGIAVLQQMSQWPTIVCRALLISAAIDSVSFGHRLHHPVLAERSAEAAARPMSPRRSRRSAAAARRAGARRRPGFLPTRLSVPTARSFETSGMIRAERKPACDEHVRVEVVRRRGIHVLDDQRLSRTHDAADHRPLDLEHDLRPRRVAAALRPARARCRSETPRRPRSSSASPTRSHGTSRAMRDASAWNASGTSTERVDDLEHRVLRLQLLDLAERGAMRLFFEVRLRTSQSIRRVASAASTSSVIQTMRTWTKTARRGTAVLTCVQSSGWTAPKAMSSQIAQTGARSSRSP